MSSLRFDGHILEVYKRAIQKLLEEINYLVHKQKMYDRLV